MVDLGVPIATLAPAAIKPSKNGTRKGKRGTPSEALCRRFSRSILDEDEEETEAEEEEEDEDPFFERGA